VAPAPTAACHGSMRRCTAVQAISGVTAFGCDNKRLVGKRPFGSSTAYRTARHHGCCAGAGSRGSSIALDGSRAVASSGVRAVEPGAIPAIEWMQVGVRHRTSSYQSWHNALNNPLACVGSSTEGVGCEVRFYTENINSFRSRDQRVRFLVLAPLLD
jgi:hypothetical protein